MSKGKKSLLLVGDVYFSSKDLDAFFDTVKTDLKDFLVIANLEGAINLGSNKKISKAVRLSLPKFKKEKIPDNLYFSLVNNHVTDFGIENFKKFVDLLSGKGFLSTKRNPIKRLSGYKIMCFADPKEQCIIRGTDFLKFTNRQVETMAGRFNDAIVIIHGGIEHRKHPTVYQRNLSRKIVNYGAEMVIFHHSHIIGQHEYWNDKLIHYG